MQPLPDRTCITNPNRLRLQRKTLYTSRHPDARLKDPYELWNNLWDETFSKGKGKGILRRLFETKSRRFISIGQSSHTKLSDKRTLLNHAILTLPCCAHLGQCACCPQHGQSKISLLIIRMSADQERQSVTSQLLERQGGCVGDVATGCAACRKDCGNLCGPGGGGTAGAACSGCYTGCIDICKPCDGEAVSIISDLKSTASNVDV